MSYFSFKECCEARRVVILVILYLILLVKTLKLRDINWFAQGQPVMKQQRQNSSSRVLASGLVFFLLQYASSWIYSIMTFFLKKKKQWLKLHTSSAQHSLVYISAMEEYKEFRNMRINLAQGRRLKFWHFKINQSFLVVD